MKTQNLKTARTKKLNLFFKVVEALYNIEGLDQEQIDELIWAYLIDNSNGIMLLTKWHGDLNDIDEHNSFLSSPIRRYCDLLNRNDINANLAKSIWFEIMDKQYTYTETEMEDKMVYVDEFADALKEYNEIAQSERDN